MKRLMLAVALACAVSAHADNQQDKFLARNGGWVDRPQTGRVVRVVNSQTKVDAAVVRAFAESAEHILHLPFVVVTGEGNGCACAADDKVGLCIAVVDDAKCPLKMIAAPDDRFVRVNVAALSADGATDGKLSLRVGKELWRGLVYGLGGGNNAFPGCLMVPAPGLKELDAIAAQMPCPAPFNTMVDTAHKIGISTVGKVTYRQACREGWAPAPTNDCQKVIWDEVNAKPGKPLKIKFDSARGK